MTHTVSSTQDDGDTSVPVGTDWLDEILIPEDNCLKIPAERRIMNEYLKSTIDNRKLLTNFKMFATL